MSDRKMKTELKDASRLVKDAAASLRKAADEAAQIAKTTRDSIRGSKEVHEAQAQAGEAIKAIEAAAKAASTAIAAGVAGLSHSPEMKNIAHKTADAARTGVEAARTGVEAARAATKAATKAAETRVKARGAGGRHPGGHNGSSPASPSGDAPEQS
jgi:ABC-type transporter Mla subunit MlaD